MYYIGFVLLTAVTREFVLLCRYTFLPAESSSSASGNGYCGWVM